METKQEGRIEERMKERGDKPVLLLCEEQRASKLRYAVGMSERPPILYSIYVEYSDGEVERTELIPAFSKDRDVAEGFCAVLARYTATPLSLHALYEDSLTP